jgi:hypothetical protein
LIERARGALMERERLPEKEAFIGLRRAAMSSRRTPPAVTGEMAAAGPPLPDGAAQRGAGRLDLEALDADAVCFLEREQGAGRIGHRLSLLLLGFLETEVLPPADRLAELGIDPTPLFAAAIDILRLYADTLQRPDARRSAR